MVKLMVRLCLPEFSDLTRVCFCVKLSYMNNKEKNTHQLSHRIQTVCRMFVARSQSDEHPARYEIGTYKTLLVPLLDNFFFFFFFRFTNQHIMQQLIHTCLCTSDLNLQI